jgi:hypothetical protein
MPLIGRVYGSRVIMISLYISQYEFSNPCRNALLSLEQVVPDSHLDAHPEYYPTTDTEAIVRPYGEELLRTYFDVVHVSYPLLDPSRFNSEPKTGDPLLAIMYNLASPFCQGTVPCFKGLSDFVHQAQVPLYHMISQF